jgi:hypothetical protein
VATLLQIRTALNGEIGVVTDAETAPWTQAVRNQAISDGYADLWRVGVWKDDKQDLTSNSDSWVYALTSIRRQDRIELLDSSSRVVDLPQGKVERDGAGGYQLRLLTPIGTGYTIRVRGWKPYISTFASDTASDDLPAEHGRIPRLKAKAILYRIEMARFARFGERQSLAPVMNMSLDQLIGIVAAAEREYEDAAASLANQRPRVGQLRSLR